MPMININNYIYTEKFSSDVIGYDYYFETFFYDVYTKYDEKAKINRYFMALSDKESLLARLNFYKKYISEIEYPIIDKQGRPEFVAGNSLLVMQQVLSLPEECFILNNKGDLLSPDEVVERITFTKELDTTVDKSSFDDYLTSNLFYKKLINHLITKGFYFLDLETLSFSFRFPKFYTPFIIDEEKFFKKYKKPTGERIYISFGSIANIKPSDYLKYYKPIDSMSIKEQITFASEIKENDEELDYEVKDGILDYYYCILRKECREYFNCHDNKENRSLPYSVLDYESGNHFAKFNYYAFGTHFSLPATKTRIFKKEGDKVIEEIKPSDFKLLSSDIDRLEFTYNAVKNYLLLHPEFSFMPQHFIKLLGLPYEALNLVRNFNFKDGEFSDFIKLIPILDVKGKVNYNLVDNEGLVVDNNDVELNNILNNLSNNSLYIYNYDKDTFFDENIIFGKTNNKNFIKFITTILKENTKEKYGFEITNLRKKLLQNHKGKIKSNKTIYNFAIEIANNDTSLFNGFDFDDSFDDNDIKEKELIDYLIKIKDKGFSFNAYNFLEKDEIIFNDFLPLPFIHLGNNFIGYSKKENGEIFFDEESKNSIKEFMEIINAFYSNGVKHYYFYTSDSDLNLSRIRVYKHAKSILGLPYSINDLIVLSKKKNEVYDIEKTLSNLSFKKGISINTNNLTKSFEKDPRVSYLLIFENILLKYHLIPFIYLSKYNNKYHIFYYKNPLNKKYINDYEDNYYLLGCDNEPLFTFASDELECLSLPTMELDEILCFGQYTMTFDSDSEDDYMGTDGALYSLEKLYYFTSFEELFTDDHFYNQQPLQVADNKLVYVLYGEIFNAYSYDNKNYFFDIDDLEKIYEAYKLNHKLAIELPLEDNIFNDTFFGIPYLLGDKLLTFTENRKKILSLEEFKEVYKFNKKPNIERNNIIYDSFVRTRENHYSIYDINSVVRYKAISKGLYISHFSSKVLDYYLNFEDKSLEYDEFIKLINQSYTVYVGNNIKDEVESLLKPKKSLFFSLLQNFTRSISSLKRIDIQKILKYKYHIEILYDEDPNFIYKLVNKINCIDKKKIYKYLENTTFLNNNRIDLPYKIKKEELVEFLLAFIRYVIHSLLKILCQYQKD